MIWPFFHAASSPLPSMEIGPAAHRHSARAVRSREAASSAHPEHATLAASAKISKRAARAAHRQSRLLTTVNDTTIVNHSRASHKSPDLGEFAFSAAVRALVALNRGKHFFGVLLRFDLRPDLLD